MGRPSRKKRKRSMLIGDMDISRLMVYVASGRGREVEGQRRVKK